MSWTKIILGLLAVWACFVVVLGLFKLQIYFPLNVGSADEIPYHRWQTVRFSTFLTIAYFIFGYVGGIRPVSAIAVINVFFKIMVVIGIILFWTEGVLIREWGVIVFFILVSLLLHKSTKLNRGSMFTKHW